MPSLDAALSRRTDAWAAHAAPCQVHYRIVAEVEPDLLCRALNLFALQWLTPRQVSAVQEEDLMLIDIALEGLSWHRAQVIGEKLRNLISVCSVQVQPDETFQHAVLATG